MADHAYTEFYTSTDLPTLITAANLSVAALITSVAPQPLAFYGMSVSFVPSGNFEVVAQFKAQG